MFTEKEIAYLQSQTLGPTGHRPARTGSRTTRPWAFASTARPLSLAAWLWPKRVKYKNVAAGNNKIAIIVDDLESIDPWKPRGIRIFGTAEALDQGGPYGDGHQLRITPTISWSWNVEGPSMVDGRFIPHRTVHVKDEG